MIVIPVEAPHPCRPPKAQGAKLAPVDPNVILVGQVQRREVRRALAGWPRLPASFAQPFPGTVPVLARNAGRFALAGPALRSRHLRAAAGLELAEL